MAGVLSKCDDGREGKSLSKQKINEDISLGIDWNGTFTKCLFFVLIFAVLRNLTQGLTHARQMTHCCISSTHCYLLSRNCWRRVRSFGGLVFVGVCEGGVFFSF